MSAALEDLKSIQANCYSSDKSLLVFLSMGFGNPYGDRYDDEVLLRMVERLQLSGFSRFSVADTVGLAQPRQVERLFSRLLKSFPEAEVGVHLHARPESARDKIAAAYQAGCTRFDAAMQGYGGCPMAEDKLVGNIATETLLQYLHEEGESLDVDKSAFEAASQHARRLFETHAAK